MKGALLLVLTAIAGVLPAQAGDKGEFQLSVQIGRQALEIDDDQVVGEGSLSPNGLEVGFAMGWRLKSGLLLEASLLHSAYTDLGGIIFGPLGLEDYSFDNYQYSGAAGWQFDKNEWRFTPKLGVARSKLTSSGEVLLTSDGERTDKSYATVPFAEVVAARRLGEHFALGIAWRETFQDFGHSRSFDVTVNYFFD